MTNEHGPGEVREDAGMTTRTALALAVAIARSSSPRWLSDTPQPGDLVVEVTGLKPADPDAIGWLVGHDLAPYNADDPLDSSVPMREVWDVIPLSGAKGIGGTDWQRWENATFVKLPESVRRMVPDLKAETQRRP